MYIRIVQNLGSYDQNQKGELGAFTIVHDIYSSASGDVPNSIHTQWVFNSRKIVQKHKQHNTEEKQEQENRLMHARQNTITPSPLWACRVVIVILQKPKMKAPDAIQKS